MTSLSLHGPLTSDALAGEIGRITGFRPALFLRQHQSDRGGDSIDMSVAFRASRYGKSLDGTDDYINCPFNKDQYERFLDALLRPNATNRIFPKTRRRISRAVCRLKRLPGAGRETLRFGPMKPAGLGRSADRQMAICGGAASAGEPASG